jgi:hypothetical protein
MIPQAENTAKPAGRTPPGPSPTYAPRTVLVNSEIPASILPRRFAGQEYYLGFSEMTRGIFEMGAP